MQRTDRLHQMACGAEHSALGCQMWTLMIQTREMEYADSEVLVSLRSLLASQTSAFPVHVDRSTPTQAFELCWCTCWTPGHRSCSFASPNSTHAVHFSSVDLTRLWVSWEDGCCTVSKRPFLVLSTVPWAMTCSRKKCSRPVQIMIHARTPSYAIHGATL